jgi:hypothetical protein
MDRTLAYLASHTAPAPSDTDYTDAVPVAVTAQCAALQLVALQQLLPARHVCTVAVAVAAPRLPR